MDFSQVNLPGVQEYDVQGFPPNTGSRDDLYIFYWINGGVRKMVLADSNGQSLQFGAAAENNTDWMNYNTWIFINELYEISNFRNCSMAGNEH